MKRNISFLTGIAFSLLLPSCSRPIQPQEEAGDPPHRYITNATLLEIEPIGEASACRILNPWRSDKWLAQYLLLPADTTLLPADSAQRLCKRYPDYTPLSVPLERMTLTNSCHAYLMTQLEALDRVAVMCDASYSHVEELHHKIITGAIRDGGSATAPNFEILLAAHTDAIWISPFENAGAGAFEHFNIPIIYCAEYMEPHPLSRAEWMKFYGRLVGRGHEADSLFQAIRYRYHAISALSNRDSNPKPTILSEHATGSTWYIPGGRSTTSRLYRDAGGTYLWHDDNHTGSLALSIETVLEKARGADFWFFTFYDPKQESMQAADFYKQSPINKQIRASAHSNVYACNTAFSPYFDETPFRPDLLLWSIRRTLHPETPPAIVIDRTDTLIDPFYFLPVLRHFDIFPL